MHSISSVKPTIASCEFLTSAHAYLLRDRLNFLGSLKNKHPGSVNVKKKNGNGSLIKTFDL